MHFPDAWLAWELHTSHFCLPLCLQLACNPLLCAPPALASSNLASPYMSETHQTTTSCQSLQITLHLSNMYVSNRHPVSLQSSSIHMLKYCIFSPTRTSSRLASTCKTCPLVQKYIYPHHPDPPLAPHSASELLHPSILLPAAPPRPYAPQIITHALQSKIKTILNTPPVLNSTLQSQYN